MPHVDEGTLHALLDGALLAEEPEHAAEVEAHLRACPDCRALLEEASGLRADAAGILAAAAPPATPAADFADVRARAARGTDGATGAGSGRRRAGAARTLRWTGRLAWAASLVLALGTGYLLRDMAGPNTANVMQRTESAGDAAAPASTEVEPAVRTPAPPPPAPGRSARGERTRAVDEAGGGAGQEEPVVAEEIRVTGSNATATDATINEAASDAAASDAPSAGASFAPAKAQAESLMQPQSRVPMMSRSAEGGVAPGETWASATLAEARAALGGPVYRLPRARIEQTYVSLDPDAPRVLTLQRLESGMPLRVVQSPGATQAAPGAEAAPAAADIDASAGLPTPEVARVTVGRYVLEVTGSLPVELLAIMAESASPAP